MLHGANFCPPPPTQSEGHRNGLVCCYSLCNLVKCLKWWLWALFFLWHVALLCFQCDRPDGYASGTGLRSPKAAHPATVICSRWSRYEKLNSLLLWKVIVSLKLFLSSVFWLMITSTLPLKVHWDGVFFGSYCSSVNVGLVIAWCIHAKSLFLIQCWSISVIPHWWVSARKTQLHC